MKEYRKTIFTGTPFLRSVALFTLCSFLATQALIPSPVSFAQNSKVLGGDPVPVSTGQVLNGRIAIPPELGTVDEVYTARASYSGGLMGDGWDAKRQIAHIANPGLSSSSMLHQTSSVQSAGRPAKTVVFIQDAHDSLEAQENISKLIGYFVEKNGIKTVFEEGYEGSLPTDDYFGFIRDPELKQKVSYFFLDHLRIGGAEYAHINRSKDFKLIGADNIQLHRENVLQFRASASKKEVIAKDLKILRKEVQSLAGSRFSKELLEWLKLKDKFDHKKIDLFTYLGRTMQLPGLRDMEKSVLKNKETQQAPAPAILAPDLILFMLEAIRSNDPVVIEKVKRIDAREVYAALVQLEEAIGRVYLNDAADKELFSFYKVLGLLDRLNDLQVTQEEYEAVKTDLKTFNTESLASFIHEHTRKPLVLSKQWERNVQDAVKFYEIAAARDRTVEKQLEEFMAGGNVEQEAKVSAAPPSLPAGTNAAVLVYGGFHKESIKRILEAQGISYVIVSPRITKQSPRHEEYYKKLMTVGSLPFERVIAPATATSPQRIFETVNGRAEIRAIYDVARLNPEVDVSLLERYVSSLHGKQEQPRSEMREDLFSIQESFKPGAKTSSQKILLINIVDQTNNVPNFPAGLYALKSYMELHHKGESTVEIKDLQLEQLESVVEDIVARKPDILGLSLMTGTSKVLNQLISLLKSKMAPKDRPLLVFGKNVPTFAASELLKKYPEAICVRGEGELALSGLLKYKQGQKSLSEVPNIVYMKDGLISASGAGRQVILDLSALGRIAYDTVRDYLSRGGNFWMETARGCPWGLCTFCSTLVFWGTKRSVWRSKPIDMIVNELKDLKKSGVERVTFTDEEFFGDGTENIERAKELALAILKSGVEMPFYINARANVLYNGKDDNATREKRVEVLKLLRKAGLQIAFVGMETGSASQIKRYGKGITLDEAEGAIRICKELGIDMAIGWIMLEPLVSKEEILESIDFIKRNAMLKFLSTPLNQMRLYPEAPYVKMLRGEEKKIGRPLVGDVLDPDTLTFETVGYKYPETEVITTATGEYSRTENDFYTSIKWFLRFRPDANQARFAYLRQSLEAMKVAELNFLERLSRMRSEDLMDNGIVTGVFAEAIRKRNEAVQKIKDSIIENGHAAICDKILEQASLLLNNKTFEEAPKTGWRKQPAVIRSGPNEGGISAQYLEQSRTFRRFGRGAESPLPHGEGFYGASAVVLPHIAGDLKSRIDRIKERIEETQAFKNKKIKLVPDDSIHHTLKNFSRANKFPVRPEDLKEYYRRTFEAVQGTAGGTVYLEGIALGEDYPKLVLKGHASETFKGMEAKLRGQNLPVIDFKFGVVVEALTPEEWHELQQVVDALSKEPVGLLDVGAITLLHFQDSFAQDLSERQDIPLEADQPAPAEAIYEKRSEIRGDHLQNLSRRDFFWLLLKNFAFVSVAGLPTLALAQMNEITIFAVDDWKIIGASDNGPGARQIKTPHGVFTEIKILYKGNQLFSVKGDGYLRGVLPAGYRGPKGEQVDWGTSFVLPGYWSNGVYYHNSRVTQAQFGSLADGTIVLNGTLEDERGNFQARDFKMIFRKPFRESVESEISFTLKAKRNFSIDANRRVDHEGFKALQFSSMNIGTVHDSDFVIYQAGDGKTVHSPTAGKNQLIIREPQPLKGGPLYLADERPSLWGYRPTVFIQMLADSSSGNFVPQGWIAESSDPNNDNLGVWIHFDGVKKTPYQKGETIVHVHAVLGTTRPGSPLVAPSSRSRSEVRDSNSFKDSWTVETFLKQDPSVWSPFKEMGRKNEPVIIPLEVDRPEFLWRSVWDKIGTMDEDQLVALSLVVHDPQKDWTHYVMIVDSVGNIESGALSVSSLNSIAIGQQEFLLYVIEDRKHKNVHFRNMAFGQGSVGAINPLRGKKTMKPVFERLETLLRKHFEGWEISGYPLVRSTRRFMDRFNAIRPTGDVFMGYRARGYEWLTLPEDGGDLRAVPDSRLDFVVGRVSRAGPGDGLQAGQSEENRSEMREEDGQPTNQPPQLGQAMTVPELVKIAKQATELYTSTNNEGDFGRQLDQLAAMSQAKHKYGHGDLAIRQGQGLVLLGGMKQGKSRLVYALSKRGWQFGGRDGMDLVQKDGQMIGGVAFRLRNDPVKFRSKDSRAKDQPKEKIYPRTEFVPFAGLVLVSLDETLKEPQIALFDSVAEMKKSHPEVIRTHGILLTPFRTVQPLLAVDLRMPSLSDDLFDKAVDDLVSKLQERLQGDRSMRPVEELDGKILLEEGTGHLFLTDEPVIRLLFNLWAVRHGETYGNKKKGMFQGAMDEGIGEAEGLNQLTKEGLKQAQEAAGKLFESLKEKILSKEEIVVVVSPRTRAVNTAAFFIEMVRKAGGNLRIIEDTEIRGGADEIDFGYCDNKTPEEITIKQGKEFVEKYRGRLDATAHPGATATKKGESFLDLLVRVKAWIERLNELFKGRTVVLFGHGTQLSALRVLLGDTDMVAEDGSVDWRAKLLPNATPVRLANAMDAAMGTEERNDQIVKVRSETREGDARQPGRQGATVRLKGGETVRKDVYERVYAALKSYQRERDFNRIAGFLLLLGKRTYIFPPGADEKKTSLDYVALTIEGETVARQYLLQFVKDGLVAITGAPTLEGIRSIEVPEDVKKVLRAGLTAYNAYKGGYRRSVGYSLLDPQAYMAAPAIPAGLSLDTLHSIKEALNSSSNMPAFLSSMRTKGSKDLSIGKVTALPEDALVYSPDGFLFSSDLKGPLERGELQAYKLSFTGSHWIYITWATNLGGEVLNGQMIDDLMRFPNRLKNDLGKLKAYLNFKGIQVTDIQKADWLPMEGFALGSSKIFFSDQTWGMGARGLQLLKAKLANGHSLYFLVQASEGPVGNPRSEIRLQTETGDPLLSASENTGMISGSTSSMARSETREDAVQPSGHAGKEATVVLDVMMNYWGEGLGLKRAIRNALNDEKKVIVKYPKYSLEIEASLGRLGGTGVYKVQRISDSGRSEKAEVLKILDEVFLGFGEMERSSIENFFEAIEGDERAKSLFSLPTDPEALYDFDVLLTEFVEGTSLGETTDFRQRMRAIVDLVEGLAYVHRKYKAFHGDLLEKNIVLTAAGRPKLIDWDTLRMLRTGREVEHIHFSLKYKDIFSVGEWLLHSYAREARVAMNGILTGDNRFRDIPIQNREPTDIVGAEDVPPGMMKIIRKAVLAEPGKNYESLDQLLSDLKEELKQEGVDLSADDLRQGLDRNNTIEKQRSETREDASLQPDRVKTAAARFQNFSSSVRLSGKEAREYLRTFVTSAPDMERLRFLEDVAELQAMNFDEELVKIAHASGAREAFHVLDVGAGKGFALYGIYQLVDKGALSAEGISKADAYGFELDVDRDPKRIKSPLHWRFGKTAEQLPADWGNRFSMVLCTRVLEYVYDPLVALEEIHRVLRPGGTASIVFSYANDKDYPVILKLLGSHDKEKYKKAVGRVHWEGFDLFDEVQRLRAQGYEIELGMPLNYNLLPKVREALGESFDLKNLKWWHHYENLMTFLPVDKGIWEKVRSSAGFPVEVLVLRIGKRTAEEKLRFGYRVDYLANPLMRHFVPVDQVEMGKDFGENQRSEVRDDVAQSPEPVMKAAAMDEMEAFLGRIGVGREKSEQLMKAVHDRDSKDIKVLNRRLKAAELRKDFHADEIRQFIELSDVFSFIKLIGMVVEAKDVNRLARFHVWLDRTLGDDRKTTHMLKRLYETDLDRVRTVAGAFGEGELEKTYAFLTNADLLGEEVVAESFERNPSDVVQVLLLLHNWLTQEEFNEQCEFALQMLKEDGGPEPTEAEIKATKAGVAQHFLEEYKKKNAQQKFEEGFRRVEAAGMDQAALRTMFWEKPLWFVERLIGIGGREEAAPEEVAAFREDYPPAYIKAYDSLMQKKGPLVFSSEPQQMTTQAIEMVTVLRKERLPVKKILDYLVREKKMPMSFARRAWQLEEERVCAQNAAISKILHTTLPATLAARDIEAAFEQALKIMDAPEYAPYWNEQGKALRDELGQEQTRSRKDASQVLTAERLQTLRKLFWNIPTIARPNTELFVDVLTNISKEALEALLKTKEVADEKTGAILKTYEIQLTNHCPNNCAQCAFGVHPGKITHMPYPLAVKLIEALRVRTPGARFFIYMDTEPLAYYDRVSGANLADLARKAKLNATGGVTHGVNVFYGTDDDLRFLFDEHVLTEISFHMLHDQRFLQLAREIAEEHLSQEAIIQRLKDLKLEESFKQRFMPLYAAKYGSASRTIGIRYYTLVDRSNILSEECKRLGKEGVLRRFQAMDDLQKLVWQGFIAACEKQLGRSAGISLASAGEYSNRIVWYGNGAVMLRDEGGFSEEDIRSVQKRMAEKSSSNTIMNEPYYLQIRPDGHVQLIVDEYSKSSDTHFRSVAQMCPSSTSSAFERAVAFLQLIAASEWQQYAASVREKDISEALRNMIMGAWGTQTTPDGTLYRGLIEARFQDPGDKKAEMNTWMGGLNYFDILEVIYLKRRCAGEQTLKDVLLKTDVHDAVAMERLYELVKQVPLPARMKITFKDFLGKGKDFAPEIMLATGDLAEPELYQHYSTFDTGLRAFVSRVQEPLTQRIAFPSTPTADEGQRRSELRNLLQGESLGRLQKEFYDGTLLQRLLDFIKNLFHDDLEFDEQGKAYLALNFMAEKAVVRSEARGDAIPKSDLEDPELRLKKEDREFLKGIERDFVVKGTNGIFYGFRYDGQASKMQMVREKKRPGFIFNIFAVDERNERKPSEGKRGFFEIAPWTRKGFTGSSGKGVRFELHRFHLDFNDQGKGVYTGFLALMPEGSEMYGTEIINPRTLLGMTEAAFLQLGTAQRNIFFEKYRALKKSLPELWRSANEKRDFDQARVVELVKFLNRYHTLVVPGGGLRSLDAFLRESLLGGATERAGFQIIRLWIGEGTMGPALNFKAVKPAKDKADASLEDQRSEMRENDAEVAARINNPSDKARFFIDPDSKAFYLEVREDRGADTVFLKRIRGDTLIASEKDEDMGKVLYFRYQNGRVSELSIGVPEPFQGRSTGMGTWIFQRFFDALPPGTVVDSSITNRPTRKKLYDSCNIVIEGNTPVVYYYPRGKRNPKRLRVVDDREQEGTGKIHLEEVLAKTVMGKLHFRAGFVDLQMGYGETEMPTNPDFKGVNALRKLLLNLKSDEFVYRGKKNWYVLTAPFRMACRKPDSPGNPTEKRSEVRQDTTQKGDWTGAWDDEAIPLAEHLRQQGNPEEMIKRFEQLMDPLEREKLGIREVIFTIAGGDGRLEVELAQDPHRAVVAVDALVGKYPAFQYDFKYGKLAIQKAAAEALSDPANFDKKDIPKVVFLKSPFFEVLSAIPDKTLDQILMIHPDSETADELLRFEATLKKKLVPGGRIFIKPHSIAAWGSLSQKILWHAFKRFDSYKVYGINVNDPKFSDYPLDSQVYVYKKPQGTKASGKNDAGAAAKFEADKEDYYRLFDEILNPSYYAKFKVSGDHLGEWLPGLPAMLKKRQIQLAEISVRLGGRIPVHNTNHNEAAGLLKDHGVIHFSGREDFGLTVYDFNNPFSITYDLMQTAARLLEPGPLGWAGSEQVDDNVAVICDPQHKDIQEGSEPRNHLELEIEKTGSKWIYDYFSGDLRALAHVDLSVNQGELDRFVQEYLVRHPEVKADEAMRLRLKQVALLYYWTGDLIEAIKKASQTVTENKRSEVRLRSMTDDSLAPVIRKNGKTAAQAPWWLKIDINDEQGVKKAYERIFPDVPKAVMDFKRFRYYLALRQKVNPTGKELSVFYGGAGTGLREALLLTAPRTVFMVDELEYDLDDVKALWKRVAGLNEAQDPPLWSGLQHYWQTKKAKGYVDYLDLKRSGGVSLALCAELSSLGLSYEDVNFGVEKGKSYLEFEDRSSGRIEGKVRFYFLTASLLKTPTEALKEVLEEKFDIYLQQAGMELNNAFNEVIPLLGAGLRDGGAWVVDSHPWPQETRYFPLSRALDENFIVQNILLNDGKTNGLRWQMDDGYGVVDAVYRKFEGRRLMRSETRAPQADFVQKIEIPDANHGINTEILYLPPGPGNTIDISVRGKNGMRFLIKRSSNQKYKYSVLEFDRDGRRVGTTVVNGGIVYVGEPSETDDAKQVHVRPFLKGLETLYFWIKAEGAKIKIVNEGFEPLDISRNLNADLKTDEADSAFVDRDVPEEQRSEVRGQEKRNIFDGPALKLKETDEGALSFRKEMNVSNRMSPDTGLKIKEPTVLVVEKKRLAALSRSAMQQFMGFAAINREQLFLVIPDLLDGQESLYLADLKALGVRVTMDLPEIAKSPHAAVIGLSDKEEDTAEAFRGRLKSQLANGVKEYFALEGGEGIILALLVAKPEDLPLKNGFHYDKAGRYQAELQAVLQNLMSNYVIISSAA